MSNQCLKNICDHSSYFSFYHILIQIQYTTRYVSIKSIKHVNTEQQEVCLHKTYLRLSRPIQMSNGTIVGFFYTIIFPPSCLKI